MPGPKIFLSAGEASGEHYGTLLMEEIRRIEPDTSFFGMGGQRMESLGFRRIVRSEDVAVMGITEVVRHLPRICGEYRKLRASLATEKPDIAVLIDFPDVNLRLARDLHKLGIPVIFFVSPQLWAWKKHRIRQVQRYVDRMLVIFPFEEAFYRERGVEARFVGHPLADLDPPNITREAFADQYNLDASKQWIGLLPGSREKEVRLNLPEMVRAAKELNEDSEYLLPMAATLTAAQVDSIAGMVELAQSSPGAPRITLVNDARATLFHARASVVASGTATVEAALIGNPFLVVYRVSALTYSIARRIVSVPFVAMVNLVAGRLVVPELIQSDFCAANVVSHLRRLLHDEAARTRMRQDLAEVRSLLKVSAGKQTAIAHAARITTQLIRDFAQRRMQPSLAQ